MSLSEAQLNANRDNAQHSTGPCTPEGKAKAALNAGKHFLTGQTVVMPGENLDLYFESSRQFREEWQPMVPPNPSSSKRYAIPSGGSIEPSPMKPPSTPTATAGSKT